MEQSVQNINLIDPLSDPAPDVVSGKKPKVFDPVKQKKRSKVLIRLALALCVIVPTVMFLYLSNMEIGPVFNLAVLWAGIWGIGLFIRYHVKTAGEKDKKFFYVITGIMIVCLIGLIFLLDVMEALSF